ncbi:hypothetical protein FRB99_001299 [Tulasnella sp. 403]|nr:hypothetical protein FRB99_001299 [Tulasnella sp. 403]
MARDGNTLKWAWKRLNATVLNDIWLELWFFSTVALAVCLINQYTEVNFTISNQLLTVLGTVLGLVISFRTTSAYDRFWEGRKLWGTIGLASRNLGMVIWIHVPLVRKPKAGEPAADAKLKAIIERKSMMNLVQAFSVSVKHYLRSEPGIYYEDLYPLLSFLPQNVHGEATPAGASTPDEKAADDTSHSLPIWLNSDHSTMKASRKSKHRHRNFNPEKVLPDVQSSVPLRPARNPPKDTIYDILPFLIIFKPIQSLVKWMLGRVKSDQDGTRNFWGKRKGPPPIDSNVPLEITLFLSSYFNMLQTAGLLTPAIATAFNNALVSMQDALTNLERIRTTPIPFAYQAHLRMSVWLYLLFLPVEIYTAFKWLTIPCTAFAAFLYLGFLEIGHEIEDPFNYDENDLDLDHFCLQIQRELAEITAHPAPDPHSYIFSQWNQPFAPSDRRSAEQIVADREEQGMTDEDAITEIRKTLLKSYQEIHEATLNTKRAKFSGL